MAVAQCAISTATWIGIAFRERNNFLEIGAEEKSIQCQPLRYSPKANGARLQNHNVRWNLLERATGVYEQEREPDIKVKIFT
jgi:hypothetical protein